MSLLGAAIAAAMIALFVWQDGVQPCNDGRRYTSDRLQPTPFHRRFCGWPPRLLMAASWVSLVFVAATLGGWWQALMFASLPGAWFCATRPTTVDAPAMALAWGASLLWPSHPALAIGLSIAGGIVHERSPVFAALYAGSPWLLCGLLAVRWFRKPAPFDGDCYVGLPTLRLTVRANKQTQDYLDWKSYVLPTRAILPFAAYVGIPVLAWIAFGVATASRLIGTDNSRFVLWGVPPILVAIHTALPGWLIVLHVMSFVRLA